MSKPGVHRWSGARMDEESHIQAAGSRAVSMRSTGA